MAEVARSIDAGASLDARDRLDGNAVSPGVLYAAQRYGHLGYLYTGPLRRWSDSELWLEARMTSLIKAGVSVDAKDPAGNTVRYFPTIVYKRMLASLDSASILVSDFVPANPAEYILLLCSSSFGFTVTGLQYWIQLWIALVRRMLWLPSTYYNSSPSKGWCSP